VIWLGVALRYGMAFGDFVKEHTNRLAHMHFVLQHASSCLVSPEPASKVAPPEPATLQVVWSCAKWLVLSTGWFEGPSTNDMRLGAFKQSLSMSIAGLLTFVPVLRKNVPQSQWAVITIAFVLTGVPSENCF
jgi:hypothetical protein